jgi:hypothetical protein
MALLLWLTRERDLASSRRRIAYGLSSPFNSFLICSSEMGLPAIFSLSSVKWSMPRSELVAAINLDFQSLEVQLFAFVLQRWQDSSPPLVTAIDFLNAMLRIVYQPFVAVVTATFKFAAIDHRAYLFSAELEKLLLDLLGYIFFHKSKHLNADSQNRITTIANRKSITALSTLLQCSLPKNELDTVVSILDW